LREERRKQRKKERQEKRKKEQKKDQKKDKTESQSDEKELEFDNSDLVDVVGQDKSFESISSFGQDVKDKVDSVGNSVSSGVTRIFGDLTNLIGTSTSTGQLQPTVGVSFGLPQAGPGYGGYQQNPVGTGGAVNPYYTSGQGIGVGPVNLNPLFSLQAGTTDSGDVALKPLVNLHLTPNGCGLLGCDKDYDEYRGNDGGLFPKGIIEAFTNPFGFHKEHYDGSDHGIYEEYTAPKPSYTSSSYGVPDSTYSAPSSGYGAPNTGHGASSSGYSASGSSYGAPSTGYSAPSAGYGAPKPTYGKPSSGYGAPSSGLSAQSTGYSGPKPTYGAQSSGYSGSSSSYSSINTNYGAPSHEYGAPSLSSKPSYNPPGKPSYKGNSQNSHHHSSKTSYKSHKQSITNGPVNVHHHYHHQVETVPEYFTREYRSNSTGYTNFFQDSNQVKRNTENSDLFPSKSVSPSQTSQPSSSSSGFRFPRGRDGRMLNIEEINGEDHSQEDSAHISGGQEKSKSVKFADRKRRSPDGIGHHGHHAHGQHQGAHHDFGHQVTGQQSHFDSDPFGPNGYRPPTCGGPESGQ
jgi:hypothetical protein